MTTFTKNQQINNQVRNINKANKLAILQRRQQSAVLLTPLKGY